MIDSILSLLIALNVPTQWHWQANTYRYTMIVI